MDGQMDHAMRLEDKLRAMILSNDSANSKSPSTAELPAASNVVPIRAAAGSVRREEFEGRDNTLSKPARGNSRNIYHQKGPDRSQNESASRHQAQDNVRRAPPVAQNPPPQRKTGYQAQSPSVAILQRPKQAPALGQPRAGAVGYRTTNRPESYGNSSSPQYVQSQRLSLRQINEVQATYLDGLLRTVIPSVEMTAEEHFAKEAFRKELEVLCKEVIAKMTGDGSVAELCCYGSFGSGFAISGSDLDVALVMPGKQLKDNQQGAGYQVVARILEKSLLAKGIGARLLTRTRVPILKVCQKPTDDLFKALLAERAKWEALPDKEKYIVHMKLDDHQKNKDADVDSTDKPDGKSHKRPNSAAKKATEKKPSPAHKSTDAVSSPPSSGPSTAPVGDAGNNSEKTQPKTHKSNSTASSNEPAKVWLREKKSGPLDFPRSGVGVQCDINFENTLALHNTHLLKCYSVCDARVKPIVLFIKAWTKARKINNAYSGTLSSYGYVLMVLHFLVNIATPPVLPNLQLIRLDKSGNTWPVEKSSDTTVDGYTVAFWRDEDEIRASQGYLKLNHQSVASLVRDFFHYYAFQGSRAMAGGFSWAQDVLSIRNPSGLMTKAHKGWTAAKTTTSENKEIRHRYLLAIEDPFEIDHNIARTVTHNGIVAIRDEFRRASRMLSTVGNGQAVNEGLLDPVVEDTASCTAVHRPKNPEPGDVAKAAVPAPAPASPTPASLTVPGNA